MHVARTSRGTGSTELLNVPQSAHTQTRTLSFAEFLAESHERLGLTQIENLQSGQKILTCYEGKDRWGQAFRIGVVAIPFGTEVYLLSCPVPQETYPQWLRRLDAHFMDKLRGHGHTAIYIYWGAPKMSSDKKPAPA